jgi:DNA-binding beta-propeller fold protein YncE
LEPGQLITTNNGEDTLSVLRASDLTEVFRAPLGLFPMQLEGPHHVALDPGGQFLYVPLSNDVPGSGSGPHGSHGNGTVPGVLMRLDAHSLLRLDTVGLDRSPGDIVVTRDGTTAYVSHYDLLKVTRALNSSGGPDEMASTVAVVDLVTMTRRHLVPACAASHGLAFSPDEHELYVTCALSDEVAILDLTQDPPAVTRVPVGPQAAVPPNAVYEPYSLAVNPDDGKVWVSMIKGRSIHVLDPVLRTWEVTPQFDSSPVFGVFTGGGRYLVPLRESGGLALLDTATRQLVRPVLAVDPARCENAHQLELSGDRQTAWLVCEGDHQGPGTVVSIALPVFGVVQVTPVGVFPDAIRRVGP